MHIPPTGETVTGLLLARLPGCQAGGEGGETNEANEAEKAPQESEKV